MTSIRINAKFSAANDPVLFPELNALPLRSRASYLKQLAVIGLMVRKAGFQLGASTPLVPLDKTAVVGASAGSTRRAGAAMLTAIDDD